MSEHSAENDAGRYIVGYYCHKGSGHFEMYHDPDAEMTCGGSLAPLYLDPEDASWYHKHDLLPPGRWELEANEEDKTWKQTSEPASSKSSEGSCSPRTSETCTTRSTDSPTSLASSDPKATSSPDGPKPTGSASPPSPTGSSQEPPSNFTPEFSVHEIERALSAADLEEGADDTEYWTGRIEAVEIVRDMLGLAPPDSEQAR